MALGTPVGCSWLVGVLGCPILESGVKQDVIEQHRLDAGVQTLAGGAETPAFEPRDLEVQGINSGLLELEFALQPLEQIAQIAQALHRLLRRIGPRV
jgi:hypothetical protein